MRRTRYIFGFKLNDYWFESNSVLSGGGMCILHTNHELQHSLYDLMIQEKTLVIDLAPTEEEIFAAFDKKSARYSIRKAERDGLKIIKAENNESKNIFVEFFRGFSQRKEIPNITLEDLKEMTVFHAYDSTDQYLGGAVFLESEDKSVYRYKHGATLCQNGENDLLIWNAIKYAKSTGFKFFDLGGIVDNPAMGEYYKRHYSFKKKFGGTPSLFFVYIKAFFPVSLLLKAMDYIITFFFKGDYCAFISLLAKFRIIKL